MSNTADPLSNPPDGNCPPPPVQPNNSVFIEPAGLVHMCPQPGKTDVNPGPSKEEISKEFWGVENYKSGDIPPITLMQGEMSKDPIQAHCRARRELGRQEINDLRDQLRISDAQVFEIIKKFLTSGASKVQIINGLVEAGIMSGNAAIDTMNKLMPPSLATKEVFKLIEELAKSSDDGKTDFTVVCEEPEEIPVDKEESIGAMMRAMRVEEAASRGGMRKIRTHSLRNTEPQLPAKSSKTKTEGFSQPSLDEPIFIAAVGVPDGYGYLVSTVDAVGSLEHTNIIPDTFVASIDVLLNPQNGNVTVPAGSILNAVDLGDPTKTGFRVLVSYAYKVPDPPDNALYAICHVQGSAGKARRLLVISNTRLHELFDRNKELGESALYTINTPKRQLQRAIGPEEYCNPEDVAKILAIWEQASMDPAGAERLIEEREQKKLRALAGWGDAVENYETLATSENETDFHLARILQRLSERLDGIEEKMCQPEKEAEAKRLLYGRVQKEVEKAGYRVLSVSESKKDRKRSKKSGD